MTQCSRGYKKVTQGLGGGKNQFSNIYKLYFHKIKKKKKKLYMYSMSGFCRCQPDYQYTNAFY